MTNKKTTRALLMAVVALILCASMLVGATFAWFTESVSSVNNIIKPGNLDMEVEYSSTMEDGSWKVFGEQSNVFDQNALWEPGYTEVVYLKVKNVGSLALKYWLDVEVASETPSTNVAGEEFYLSTFIKYGIVVLNSPEAFKDREAAHAAVVADAKWMYEPSVTAMADYAPLAAGTDAYVALVAYMPQTVGNDANHKTGVKAPTINLGITLRATQDTVEFDSFDQKYDELADKLDVIFTHGGSMTLPGFDSKTDPLTVKPGVNVSLDIDGGTLSSVADANTFVTNYGSLLLNGADKDGNKGTLAFNGMGLETVGDATVNDVVIDAGNAANYAAAAVAEDAELVLNNVDIPSAGGAIAAANGGKVIFNGGSVSVNTTSTSGRYLFYAEGAGSEIVINEGNFNIPTGQNMKRAYVYAGAGTKVTINGGTFGKASTRSGYTDGILGTGTVEIKGGTFGFNPTKWVADGYKAEKVGANWIVVSEDVAAVVSDAASLQAALDAAVDGDVIYVAGTINGDVTATQKADVKVTIEGNGNTFAGVLTVDGKSATYLTAGLTVKNFVFKADSISADACIRLGNGTNATRYTCNVTVSGCTFDVPGAVGVKSYTGGDKNLIITACKATAAAHSLAQLKGIDGVLVEKCEVNSVRGVNLNNSDNVTITGSVFDVEKYAVRFGESNNSVVENYEIINCTMTSANVDGDAVIVLRAGATNANLTLTNTPSTAVSR